MKRVIDVREQRPWLDIVSYGRGQRGRLGSAHYADIARTTGSVPEVMVKVTGGGRSVRQVLDEIDYFDREGELQIETDDGMRLRGAGVEKQLVEDWDLELESQRSRSPYSGRPGRRSPKIVHNLMFSMPFGTPPQKVLAAAQKFAREKFALKHRYAMVLHTDQKHPHVHMLVKAMSEQADGVRLHITKPMLREWRRDFAKYLRELGVAANATDRKSRGVTKPQKKDGIYRAHLRGKSTHMRERVEGVAAELLKGDLKIEAGKAKMLKTREEVKRGWAAIGEQLKLEGQLELAERVGEFVRSMPPVRTEKEQIAAGIIEKAREARLREQRPAR